MITAPNRTNLCLITAVEVEFKTAISLLSKTVLSAESNFKICRGLVGDRRITVLQCGMGARGFAEWLSEHLKTNSYDALIVVGLAGGLDPKLKAGDAVIYDSCLDARGSSAQVRCDSNLIESLFDDSRSLFLGGEVVKTIHRRDAENAEPTQREASHLCETSAKLCASAVEKAPSSLLSKPFIYRGTGITTSRILTDTEDKLQLGEQRQALAVDMESFDVLRVASEFGLPAAAVRVISDEAGHDLPDFNSAYDSNGRMNYWHLVAVMTQRPTASFRFLISLKSVIRSLRKSLEVVLRV